MAPARGPSLRSTCEGPSLRPKEDEFGAFTPAGGVATVLIPGFRAFCPTPPRLEVPHVSGVPTPDPSSAPAGAVPGAHRARRLSHELATLAHHLAERRVTVRELIAALHGRAFTVLLVVLALPFCTPLPLPGLSTPFGIVIALIGARLSLGQEPWLPARLLDTGVPPRFFSRVLTAARGVTRVLEWALRPRWTALVEARALHRVYGLVILVSGLLLLLPLPIPFSNTFPALTIVLTASALLERDGLVAAAGFALFLLSLGLFGALAWGGVEGVQALRSSLS